MIALRRSVASLVAPLLAGAGVVGLTLALALSPPEKGAVAVVTGVSTGLAVVAVGATGLLLTLRRRHNALGWLLLSSFVLLVGFFLVQAWPRRELRSGVDDRLTHAAVWLGNWMWVPIIGMLALYPLLLFPDGHYRNRFWRGVGWTSAVALTVMSTGFALGNSQYTRASGASAPNPLGDLIPQSLANVMRIGGAFCVMGLVALGLGGLFVRYRHGDDIVRAQLRWFFAAGSLWLGFLAYPGQHGDGGLVDAFSGVVFAAYPVAIAIAVMRYRLFDIDRIISRTTSYMVVTACLVTLYAIIVTTTTRIFSDASNLAVAAATLAAAATARPLLHRVQRVVDRRFNRSRYDGRHTAEVFATSLRHEIDPSTIQRSVLGTVQKTLEPVTVAIWTRP